MAGQAKLVFSERIKDKVPMVSFIGDSGSGKTTLLEIVIRLLRGKGYKVATIKHTHHDFEIDRPGKDTWRLAQAGSDIVALSSTNKVALVEHLDAELTLDELSTLFKGKADIVLIEGYKNDTTPKIMVVPSGQRKKQLCREEDILATVSSHLSSPGVPQFDDDDVMRLIDLLITQIGNDSSGNIADTIHEVDSIPRYKAYQSNEFEKLLAESTSVHGHVCPGQVLGVRMAICGCQELGIERPKEEPKRMIVYVEIDRCATDAIQVAIGCKLGKRTMKYVDYGKLAATFVDLLTGNAVRVVVREDVRDKAASYRREGQTKYDAEVVAYKAMPDAELFNVEKVLIQIPEEDMPGPPLSRVICHQCGEGVNDHREIKVAGKVLCRACAHGAYYEPRLANSVRK
jgi:formylmethanofuran dehydrogenase subunit E